MTANVETFTEKAWASVCAAAALRGLSLYRTNPSDGPVRVFAVSTTNKAHMLTPDEVDALLGSGGAR